MVPSVDEWTVRHPDHSRIKIISNLPYNITTDCLRLYLPMGDIVSNLMFMIQDEVAQRLCHDGTGDATYRVCYREHISRLNEYVFCCVDNDCVHTSL